MNGLPDSLIAAATRLVMRCRQENITVAIAESCTGGLVCAAITAIPGSSEVFDRGFITYANAAKSDLLGIEPAMIAAFGAVSETVARAMAEAVLRNSPVDRSVAITGIAGPTGGSPDKPVGTVHIANARRSGMTIHHACHFDGDRDTIRLQAAIFALTSLVD